MNSSENKQIYKPKKIVISNITVLKETWPSAPDNKPAWKPKPPQVDVHYYVRVHSQLSHKARSRIMASTPLVLSLMVGVVAGSLIVWESRFGEANRYAQQETEEFLAQQNYQASQPWVKQLDFHHSELNIVAEMLPLLIEENRHQPTAEELANEERKNKLRAYFEKRKSPFAKSDETIEAFLDSSNMKLMIAISFVESTMGKRCYYHNCSGIGGYPPNLRKYDSYADWVRDFDSLLERRYKGMEPEQFMGVYVQPGSPNWINGVRQILAELKKAEIE